MAGRHVMSVWVFGSNPTMRTPRHPTKLDRDDAFRQDRIAVTISVANDGLPQSLLPSWWQNRLVRLKPLLRKGVRQPDTLMPHRSIDRRNQ